MSEYQKLRNVHREILRLAITGLRNDQIAAELGCGKQTVSNILNSEVAQYALRNLHEMRDRDAVEIGDRIESASKLAMTVIEETLNGSRPVENKELAKVAFHTLGLAGYTPTKKIENTQKYLVSAELLASVNAIAAANQPLRTIPAETITPAEFTEEMFDESLTQISQVRNSIAAA
jgi:predicted transcriptional regulator